MISKRHPPILSSPARRANRVPRKHRLSTTPPVMAGLDPAIHASTRSDQTGGKIIPIGVDLFYQRNLPFPLPSLETGFALDCLRHGRIVLVPDKLRDAVAAREFRSAALLVIPDPQRQVIRHADIERAVLTARQYVDVAPTHCRLLD